jgi:hypothetical protein
VADARVGVGIVADGSSLWNYYYIERARCWISIVIASAGEIHLVEALGRVFAGQRIVIICTFTDPRKAGVLACRFYAARVHVASHGASAYRIGSWIAVATRISEGARGCVVVVFTSTSLVDWVHTCRR